MISRFKRAFKEALMRHWHIPFSPVPHVSPVVYDFVKDRTDLTVVDVGAHTGQFTLGLAGAFGVKNALLVEPLPSLVESIRSEKGLRRFDIEQCAAGRSDGEVTLNHFVNAPYVSSMLELDLSISGMKEVARGESQPLVVPMRTIDRLLANKQGYDSIDIMKIDVQGVEHDVLAGAKETLARTEAVYCEVSYRPVYAGSCTFFDVHDALISEGFTLAEVEPGYRAPNGELLQADAFFRKLDQTA